MSGFKKQCCPLWVVPEVGGACDSGCMDCEQRIFDYLLLQRLHKPLISHEVTGHIHVPVVDQNTVLLLGEQVRMMSVSNPESHAMLTRIFRSLKSFQFPVSTGQTCVRCADAFTDHSGEQLQVLFLDVHVKPAIVQIHLGAVTTQTNQVIKNNWRPAGPAAEPGCDSPADDPVQSLRADVQSFLDVLIVEVKG